MIQPLLNRLFMLACLIFRRWTVEFVREHFSRVVWGFAGTIDTAWIVVADQALKGLRRKDHD
jgi:hypothetical protein